MSDQQSTCEERLFEAAKEVAFLIVTDGCAAATKYVDTDDGVFRVDIRRADDLKVDRNTENT